MKRLNLIDITDTLFENNNIEVKEGIGQVLRGSTDDLARIGDFAKKTGMDANKVKLAWSKNIRDLENEFTKAASQDVKTFRSGNANSIGPLSTSIKDDIIINKVLNHPNVGNLTGKDYAKIVSETEKELLTKYKQIESRALGKVTPTNPTNTTTPVNVPPATQSYVKKTMSLKKLGLLSMFTAGATAIGLAYLLLNRGHSDDEKEYFDNMANSINNAPPCIQNIIKKYNPNPTVDDNGNIMLVIPNYEGVDGGVVIKMDGTITQIKTGKKGKWTCKTLHENKSLSFMNIVTEQSNEITPQQMSTFVNDAVDDLDGWVSASNLENLKNIFTSLNGKTYKGHSALSALLSYYKRHEGGDDLMSDLNSVGERTIGVGGMDIKDELLSILKGGGTAGSTDNNSAIDIVWDGENPTTPTTPGATTPVQPTTPESGSTPTEKIKYSQCTGTYKLGCYNVDVIGKVQRCLGLKVDGYFGPVTQGKLSEVGFKNGFTDNDVDTICKSSSANAPSPEREKAPEMMKPRGDEPLATPQPTLAEETPRRTYERYFPEMDVPKQGRIRLTVDNLSAKDLNNLNAYFATQNYRLIKSKYADRYGSKYVWKYDTQTQK